MEKPEPVSPEQARKLQSLGFPDIADLYYMFDLGDGTMAQTVRKSLSHYQPKNDGMFELVPAPTLELAARWLREDMGIDVFPIRYSTTLFDKTHIFKTYTLQFIVRNVDGWPKDSVIRMTEAFDTCDEALSYGIDLATKILEEKRKKTNERRTELPQHDV